MDGNYLAFLSARGQKKTQLWLLDRRGGEASRLSDFKGDISSFAWSPDSKRLVLVARDPDPDEEIDTTESKQEESNKERAKPILVDRLQFKRDGRGFLDELRDHLYLFELESRQSVQLTQGPYDDSEPVWSPDGVRIAFVSNRSSEPDSNFNTDIFLVAAQAGQDPSQLTHSAGSDRSPAFSPDGRLITYLAGGEPSDIWYATNNVALISLDSSPKEPRLLTKGIDRNLSRPTFNSDGSSILFLLEDRTNVHLAQIGTDGSQLQRLVSGDRTLSDFDLSPHGQIVVLESQLQQPAEISRLDRGTLRRVTRVNDAFLAQIGLSSVERFQATSPDGTVIDAFLTLPSGTRTLPLPALLRIHGGPVNQFSTQFSFEWQLLAAHGYAVVAANPRGSSGRGRDFSYAIWADWGNKDFQDIIAAIDEVITRGVADAERLGVGGWSYGGILTNYVITQTTRFKAAISGASEVNYTANYGHDHYQRQWEAELGLPWENPDLWVRISPFFSVDKVRTPTLILCGQQDWNVPLQNSEQLYQALRRLGIDTRLVIYPGQGHSIKRPSFRIDRYRRYLAWYDKYVKGESESKTRSR